MTAQDQKARPDVLQQLKDYLGVLTDTVDKQTRGVLGKDGVRIVDVLDDEFGRTQLVGQYSIGGSRVFSRDDYLPEGDDGTSVVYQAQVLEQLAREQVAVLNALEEVERSKRLLDDPPVPKP